MQSYFLAPEAIDEMLEYGAKIVNHLHQMYIAWDNESLLLSEGDYESWAEHRESQYRLAWLDVFGDDRYRKKNP